MRFFFSTFFFSYKTSWIYNILNIYSVIIPNERSTESKIEVRESKNPKEGEKSKWSNETNPVFRPLKESEWGRTLRTWPFLSLNLVLVVYHTMQLSTPGRAWR